MPYLWLVNLSHIYTYILNDSAQIVDCFYGMCGEIGREKITGNLIWIENDFKYD